MQLYKIQKTEQRLSESDDELHCVKISTEEYTTYSSPHEYIMKYHSEKQILAKHDGNHEMFLLFHEYDNDDKTYHSETYTTLIFTLVEETKWIMTKKTKPK